MPAPSHSLSTASIRATQHGPSERLLDECDPRIQYAVLRQRIVGYPDM